MLSKHIFLPKPIYELLPLFYLSLGLACIMAGHSIGFDLLAAYLSARGLFHVILRINYRSPNQALTQSPRRRRGP